MINSNQSILLSLVLFFCAAYTNGASVDIGSRLIGGDEAVDGEFPYQVSLRRNHRHFCGGAIVTVRHIITSAYCVSITSLADLTVITGSNSIARGGETHGVSSMTSHPEYIGRSDNWRYDIAVLTLSATLTVTSLQSPIPVATVSPPDDAETVVTGWGQFLYDSVTMPTRLQSIKPMIVNNTVCRSWLSSSVADVHLCAVRTYGVNVCTADEGNPMVYNGQLVGIVSWIPHPCGSSNPAAYTRISLMLDFIESITGLGLSK